jgi:hypothetical protein
MLAAGAAGALPVEAPAVPAPDTDKAYAAFFLGQGGYLFSWEFRSWRQAPESLTLRPMSLATPT